MSTTIIQYFFFTKDLTLIISTELSEAEVELEEDLEEMSSVQIDSFAKEQEWTLHECVSFTPKVTTKAYTNPKFKNPTVVAGCFAGRRAGFFIWNVMLIMVINIKCFKINIVKVLKTFFHLSNIQNHISTDFRYKDVPILDVSNKFHVIRKNTFSRYMQYLLVQPFP